MKRLVVQSLLPVALLSFTVLAGCGQVRKAVGMSRQSPDEFAVTTQEPLELPADMTDLPPPQPGAPRPQASSVQAKASEALDIMGATTTSGPSDSESALLDQANVASADPNIRREIDAEAAADRRDGETIGQKILFWQAKPEPGTIVDPEAEKARIEAARKAGEPITAGETPMIKPHKPGMLIQ